MKVGGSSIKEPGIGHWRLRATRKRELPQGVQGRQQFSKWVRRSRPRLTQAGGRRTSESSGPAGKQRRRQRWDRRTVKIKGDRKNGQKRS